MKDYPIIKFTLFFIAGITLQHFFPFGQVFLLVTFIFFLLLLGSILFFKLFSQNKILDIVVIVPIILCGALMYLNATYTKAYYPFKTPKLKNASLFGTICKIELIKEKRLTFHLQVDSIQIKNKPIKFYSKIICNVYVTQSEADSLYDNIKIGNYIKYSATINQPKRDRNPFEFNYEQYLSDRGISMLATAYNPKSIVIIDNSYSFMKQAIFEVRKALDSKITLLHNNTTRGLLRGLLLADRSGIDYNTNVDFMNAGVVHVLSVSGLHVGYIVLIFLFLFNRFNLYWRSGLTIICLFCYMLITGSEAPVFRSTVMASILLATPFLGRDTNGYNTLSIAALVILLINPLELFNPSFQLSFSAILALIMLFPKVKDYVDNLNLSSQFLKYFLMFLGSTLIAQIGTLPFTLVYFGRISITAIAANYIVIPLSGIIVGLGIVSIVLSTISFWFASIYSTCTEFLTYILFYTVRIFGNPNYSFISIRQFTLYDSILFYAAFGIMFTFWKYFQNYKTKTLFMIAVSALFFVFVNFDDEELLDKNELSVVSIDVGQGDAFLIKFSNGKTALVDAGEATKHFDNGKRVILPMLEKLGIDKIDYAFISHVDSDHYMGIIELIKNKKVVELYKPYCDYQKKNDVDFESILKRNHIPIKYYSTHIKKIGNAKIYFLSENKQSFSTNDKSGVFKLVYGKTSILFTGDAGVEIERELVNKYGDFLKSDILKVAHHGSKSSTSVEFLNKVRPKYALISAGVMNKFRHPSKEVMASLSKFRTTILRTDLTGANILSSDGKNIEIINWRD